MPLGRLQPPARAASAGDPWAAAARILDRIRPPAFPARDVPITDSGAVGDGQFDCSSPIRAAIERCRAADGGVNLHLEPGATLAFARDPAR